MASPSGSGSLRRGYRAHAILLIRVPADASTAKSHQVPASALMCAISGYEGRLTWGNVTVPRS
jgi:hypothetical protein